MEQVAEHSVDSCSESMAPANGSSVETTNGDPQHISKRQQKKLLRKEKWLAGKEERKRKEKEKLKLKRQEKINAGVELGPSRKRLKLCTMKDSVCKQRVAIDMSFDEYMNERDLNKTIKQLHRCYSCNRREANPMQFYFTSFTGNCLQTMEKNNGFRNWDVYFKSESYTQVFPTEEIVYLTSESENVVESLDKDKVYIIGGLVDHNAHKGLCHRLAQERGIAHARLPIDEYLEMKTRKVLTIDHVFQIILAVSTGKSWKDAFLTIIPARKGATELKDKEDLEETEDYLEDSGVKSTSDDLDNSREDCKKTSDVENFTELQETVEESKGSMEESSIETSNDLPCRSK